MYPEKKGFNIKTRRVERNGEIHTFHSSFVVYIFKLLISAINWGGGSLYKWDNNKLINNIGMRRRSIEYIHTGCTYLLVSLIAGKSCPSGVTLTGLEANNLTRTDIFPISKHIPSTILSARG